MKFYIYIILFCCAGFCFGQTSNYLTSFSFAKSFSMGGAATAVQSNMESIVYNPAAKYFSNTRRGNLFLNPVSAYLALSNTEEFEKYDQNSPLQWLSYAGLYAKAISYNSPSFQINLLLDEELPFNPFREHKNNPEINGLMDWHFHTLSSSIRLAPQVSIGASLFAFNTRTTLDSLNYELGACYSILMSPSEKFSAGISYFNLPQNVDSIFYNHFRLSDETINVGVSYKPIPFWTLALDVRNVSEQNKYANLEIHAGTQVAIHSVFALRAGYSEFSESGEMCYTAGFGLGAEQILYNRTYAKIFNHFQLNYAVQMLELNKQYSFQHFLTFLIRL